MISLNKIVLILLVYSVLNSSFVNGGKGKGKPLDIVQDESVVLENYQGNVFIYPKGMRSERDIPICTKWISKSPKNEEKNFDREDGMQSDMAGVSGDFGFSNATGLRDILLTKKNENTEDNDDRWESACNIIHNRYFYPPVVERLCRCPDRTECPWEWKQPPNYPKPQTHSGSNDPSNPSTASGQLKGSRDSYTIMLSSRSQAKFCVEVNSVLPRCHNVKDQENKEIKSKKEKKMDISQVQANLIKTVKKVGGGDEIPTVTVNCYCPPLYRQWNYLGQTERTDFGNGTIATDYYYKCDKLPRCRTNNRCGNIRTDLHFSFYHCSCPRGHLCLPKVYPIEPDSPEYAEEDVNEVLYRGQVAPAFCTPFIS